MVDQLTRPVVLLGDPVDHSLSPAMHNAAFDHLGLNLVYLACRVRIDEVVDAVRGLQALGAVGANVTVPHKSRVLSLGTDLDPDVQSSGAANVIRFDPDGISLFNTDVFAVRTAVDRHRARPGPALILGAGGAARAAIRALTGRGDVILCNRTRERALALADELGLAPPVPFETDAVTRVAADATVIVNATGSGGEQSVSEVLAAAVAAAGASTVVIDFVYRSGGTGLERMAIDRGLAAVSGLELLFWQGVKSFELWTSMPAPQSVMWRALAGGDSGAQIPYRR